jgi:hypothetical protein
MITNRSTFSVNNIYISLNMEVLHWKMRKPEMVELESFGRNIGRFSNYIAKIWKAEGSTLQVLGGSNKPKASVGEMAKLGALNLAR